MHRQVRAPGTTAVIGDDIDRVDAKPVKKCDQHGDLISRRDTLTFRDLGVPQAEQIRRRAIERRLKGNRAGTVRPDRYRDRYGLSGQKAC